MDIQRQYAFELIDTLKLFHNAAGLLDDCSVGRVCTLQAYFESNSDLPRRVDPS